MSQVANSPVVFDSKDGVTASLVQAVPYGPSDASAGSGDQKWLRVELHYTVVPKAGDFLDAVQFKIWIEGRDLQDPQGKPGVGIAVALTGAVTYVNINGSNRDNYGVFFVPPATMDRFKAGSAGASDFDQNGSFNIHAEADVDGKPVDAIDKTKGEKDITWYQTLKQVSGMVYLQYQTPFILTDPDRYPPIKQTQTQ